MELWSRPVLREDDEGERRVDWIELFFDLAFVALVATLSSGLARSVGFVELAAFALYFSAMWVVWRYAAIYSDRFETNDLSYRASLLALMAAVVAMAVSAGEGFQLGFRGFAVTYAVADAIAMILWLRGGRHNPRFRPLAGRLAIAHGVSITLWIVAAVLGWPLGGWVAALALLVDLSAPLVTTRQQNELPPLSSSHLPERFGLFTIIVLGEAVFSITVGLSRLKQPSAFAWATGAVCLLLVTTLYWLYFDQVMSGEPPTTALRRNVTQYIHLPLVMSAAAVSAVFPELVAAPAAPLSLSSRLLLSLGLALELASIALLDALLVQDKSLECLLHESRILELVAAGVLALAGLVLWRAPGYLFVVLASSLIVAIIIRSGVVRSRGTCKE